MKRNRSIVIVGSVATGLILAVWLLQSRIPVGELPLEHPLPSTVANSTANIHSETVAQNVLTPRIPNGCSPALEAFLNRDAEARVTPDFNERIPSVTDPVQVAAVVYVLKDSTDEDTVRNEAMNLLRRSGFSRLDDVLLAVLDQPSEKERFRSFVVQHLGHELTTVDGQDRKERIANRLQRAMNDPQDSVRREALMALVEAGDSTALGSLISGLSDPSCAGLRDLYIRFLLEQNNREAIPAIRKLANDPDEATRIAAIHALGKWRDENSRPLLSEALKSDQERTRRAAELALNRLDGQLDAPFLR